MNILAQLEKLRLYIERNNFSGYDPYDALNSPIIQAFSFNQKYIKIIWTQLFRRLPFNLRPFFRIHQGHNPKALGLFLWGYVKLFGIDQKTEYLEKINYLCTLLANLKSKGYSGNCWGYNFPWQSRAFYIRQYTPTIVNSSFIGHALLDAYEITGDSRFFDLAIPIKDFILRDLHKTFDGNTFCFSYTPLDYTVVHNANLLGASFLIRLYTHTKENNLKDTALASLAFSMNHQKTDGSWYYAESETQQWIDSFHTGFNLQSIKYFLDLGFADEYHQKFEGGVDFYAEKFFLNDGTPKYYHNKIFPIDIHSPAQAVVFFSLLGKKYGILCDHILKWMLDTMQDPEGFFYFRKNRLFTNKLSYMRWNQAWAFHALTEYIRMQENTKNG